MQKQEKSPHAFPAIAFDDFPNRSMCISSLTIITILIIIIHVQKPRRRECCRNIAWGINNNKYGKGNGNVEQSKMEKYRAQ